MKLKEIDSFTLKETGDVLEIDSVNDLMDIISSNNRNKCPISDKKAIVLFEDGTYIDYQSWIE